MTVPVPTGVVLTRAEQRYTGGEPGIESRYAFSFGDHYDSRNIHFGPLLAVNEERLEPGAGFAPHRHRDTEIVTWVLEGALEHRDSEGNQGVLRPGTAQVMSAGAGVEHTERNAGPTPVRFVQTWLQPDAWEPPPAGADHPHAPGPDAHGGVPRYARRTVPPELRHAVLAAGPEPPAGPGPPSGAAPLRRRDAELHLVRRAALDTDGASEPGEPGPQELTELPRAPFLYVHVVRGELRCAADTGRGETDHRLLPGDALRVRDNAWARPRAGEHGVELLVWAMHSDLRRG